LEEKLHATFADLDQLDQAILAKAFRGELVPQGPSDEPASALLARIRERRGQRAEATKGKKHIAKRSEAHNACTMDNMEEYICHAKFGNSSGIWKEVGSWTEVAKGIIEILYTRKWRSRSPSPANLAMTPVSIKKEQ